MLGRRQSLESEVKPPKEDHYLLDQRLTNSLELKIAQHSVVLGWLSEVVNEI